MEAVKNSSDFYGDSEFETYEHDSGFDIIKPTVNLYKKRIVKGKGKVVTRKRFLSKVSFLINRQYAV